MNRLLNRTILVFFLFAPLAVFGRGIEYKTRAYDARSGKLIYLESHREIWQNGRHRFTEIRYLTPAGKVFGYKRLDYANSRTAPEFQMQDNRNGMVESVKRRGGIFETSGRKFRGKELKTARLPAKSPMVVDAGFDYFIRENWNALASGRKMKAPFLVPMAGDSFLFEMKKVGERTVEGRPAVTFRIGIASWLLSIFAESVEVTYDRESRRLVEYRGISNLRNTAGKNYRTRIVFDYPRRALALNH